MNIHTIIWLDYIKDKLQWKHSIETYEVVEIFHDKPRFFKKEKGNIEGENLYNALGITESGRHISVFFIHKKTADALVITARDMTSKEKQRYGKK